MVWVDSTLDKKHSMIVPAKLPERQRKGNQTSDDSPKGGQRDDIARRVTTKKLRDKGIKEIGPKGRNSKIKSILLKTPGCRRLLLFSLFFFLLFFSSLVFKIVLAKTPDGPKDRALEDRPKGSHRELNDRRAMRRLGKQD